MELKLLTHTQIPNKTLFLGNNTFENCWIYSTTFARRIIGSKNLSPNSFEDDIFQKDVTMYQTVPLFFEVV